MLLDTAPATAQEIRCHDVDIVRCSGEGRMVQEERTERTQSRLRGEGDAIGKAVQVAEGLAVLGRQSPVSLRLQEQGGEWLEMRLEK